VNGLGPAAGVDYDLPMHLTKQALLPLLAGLLATMAVELAAVEGPLQVCPVLSGESHPPSDYDRPDCWSAGLYEIDIQDRMLWIRARLEPAPYETSFLGVLISMKAASEVFLAGEMIGRNGLPGPDRETELPGRMDVVIPLDRSKLNAADRTLDLKVSSHHNWLRLRYPIHGLQLVDYPSQQDQTLRYYLPSLLPMGVFLLAVFYFGSLTLRSEDWSVPALLAALSALVMLQLLFEASRGLYAYAYPVQDLRLIGILVCSIGFGLCLAGVSVKQFLERHRLMLMVLVVLAMTIAIVLTTSWDTRTALVLLMATSYAWIAAIIGWRKGRPLAPAHIVALTLFLLANLYYPDQFIDHGFYLLAALFLVGLMVLQAISYGRERQGRIEQRQRADQLQQAIDQSRADREPQTLTVPGTGQVQTVRVDELIRVQGAGDYAALHLMDGRELLHNATLNELDTELPSNFLRVHRSHLVNTRCINRLERKESGTGTLYLSNGQTVPVSRRIMPGVRRALR